MIMKSHPFQVMSFVGVILLAICLLPSRPTTCGVLGFSPSTYHTTDINQRKQSISLFSPISLNIRRRRLVGSDPSLWASKYSSSTTPEGEPSNADVKATNTTNLEDDNSKPFSLTLLGTILRKVFSPIRYLQRCLFRAVVHCTAAFLTAVISEPNCNQAFATVIMRGCNMVLTSNYLKERLVAAQKTLSQNDPSLAKLTGEDFVKILYNFIVGLADPNFEYSSDSVDKESSQQD